MPKSTASKKKPALLKANKKFSSPAAVVVVGVLLIVGVVLIAKSLAFTTTSFPYATPNYPNCPYNRYIVNVGGSKRYFYYHMTIQSGSTGQCVVKLQRLINRWRGYNALTVDGQFGPLTLAQVKAFQRIYTPTLVDGIVGKRTWGWLYYEDNCSPTLCPLITIQ